MARLDYFFLTILALRNLDDAQIHFISWSHHASVTIDLEFNPMRSGIFHWQLNDFLLKLPETIAQAISRYFNENETSLSDMSTVCCAHKAVIRGLCIAECTRLKKHRVLVHSGLLSDLRCAKSVLQERRTVDSLRRVVELRSVIWEIDIGEVERALLRLRQRYYNGGNKAITLLAKRLRDSGSGSGATSIRTEGGFPIFPPRRDC